MTVPTFPLLDGTHIPFMAWGNGTGDAKKNVLAAGHMALAAGIRHIDTAQGYNNEKETGDVVSGSKVPRANIWVTSKLSGLNGDPTSPPILLEKVRASVLSTLATLGSQPDLLLVHNPFVPAPGELVKFWKVLEGMKDSGELTASLGVSNFRPQDLEELLKVARYKPVVNQLEYHPYVLTHLQPVLDILAAHSILIEAYGPLSPLLRHPTGGPIKPILERIAKRLSVASGTEVDSAQALLMWIKAKGVVAVTASGNEGRIAKLAACQKLPELTQEEVDEVEQAGRKIHFRFYDEHMNIDFPAPSLPSQ